MIELAKVPGLAILAEFVFLELCKGYAAMGATCNWGSRVYFLLMEFIFWGLFRCI